MKNPFRHNVGLLDRILRVWVGIALVTVGALAADGIVAVILLILSIPLLFSGITGFCPTYSLLGISTVSAGGTKISRMLQACCSADAEYPMCPPMMKNTMQHLNDRATVSKGRVG